MRAARLPNCSGYHRESTDVAHGTLAAFALSSLDGTEGAWYATALSPVRDASRRQLVDLPTVAFDDCGSHRIRRSNTSFISASLPVLVNRCVSALALQQSRLAVERLALPNRCAFVCKELSHKREPFPTNASLIASRLNATC